MIHQLTVLVIEDHPIVLAGCRRMLEDRQGIRVLEASTGAEGLRLNAEHHPDAVIMDLRLPDMAGFDVLQMLLTEHASLRVLIFSAFEEPAMASRALQAGAAGYITKNDDPESILEGIEHICRGEIYLGRSMAIHIAMMGIKPVGDPFQDLTPRELNVLELLSQGLSMYEISQDLGVGYRTVASLTANIRKRLGIPNMFALVKFAIDNAPIKRR